MNIIDQLIKDYQYNIHMEDDWHFFEKRNYIGDALTVFGENSELGQVLFNRNYAERDRCVRIAGGIAKTSRTGFRYLIHEHYQQGSSEWQQFEAKNYGRPHCCYWPHYSLRPSILKVSCLQKVGPYENLTGHFEMDYAQKYFEMGYRSAFFDTISCWHIGKCTWESGENSYSLNGIQQFQTNSEVQDDGEWLVVTNLDSYGNDIECVGAKSIEYLKLAAEADQNCIGFNTLGYLKNKIEPETKWISVNYTNFQMYINKKRWNNKCE